MFVFIVCEQYVSFIRFPDIGIESEYYCKCNGARWRFTYTLIKNTSSEMRYNENINMCILCLHSKRKSNARFNFGMISKMCTIKSLLSVEVWSTSYVLFCLIFFTTELRKYFIYCTKKTNKILKEFLSLSLPLSVYYCWNLAIIGFPAIIKSSYVQ